MVLAGGPDRERAVSLMSGSEVAGALRQAGHDVVEFDISPSDLAALDWFAQWPGDVVFPVFHGPWGEGGGLQRILDERRLPYVGSRTIAAELCMDKFQAKQVLVRHGLPTPAYEKLGRGDTPSLAPPLVIKALCEGSSFEMAICRDAGEVADAAADLFQRHQQLLFEQFVAGLELTVGVIGPPGAPGEALPPIQIVPAVSFYDYEAKYDRDDTQYLFDIDLPRPVLDDLVDQALRAHEALGCRHLSRVDFIADADRRLWILELNTLPGFTAHSLLPKAAAKAGISMPRLVDRLVRWAAAE